ncbi:CBS domain-containing protein [Falsiroseomonas sp. HW251]|uniref:CBS domain-containing protein n=1 Tax=Falsiroseomonas sp. HW251 TaxID=3390998 RepID=UPI003D3228EA
MTIARILKGKGTRVVSVGAEDEVGVIARTLSEARIGAVLVRDGAGDVLGIVSERDIVRCIAAHGTDAITMPARLLMTRALQTVTPRTKINEALSVMTDRRIRHLPVIEDDGSLAGLVSIGDLVKQRIDDAVHEAEELRHYVETAG